MSGQLPVVENVWAWNSALFAALDGKGSSSIPSQFLAIQRTTRMPTGHLAQAQSTFAWVTRSRGSMTVSRSTSTFVVGNSRIYSARIQAAEKSPMISRTR
jgi:hypothetical protein